MMGRRKFTAVAMGFAAIIAMGSPVSAYATVEGDQAPLTDEEISASIASGDVLSSDSIPATLDSKRDYAVSTLGGSNRYHTSAVEARSAFSSSQWIIVASGAGYADSICAAGLAGALNCPIVLTEPGALTDTTAAVVRDLGVRDVILLGSEAVASSAVQSSLEGIVGGEHVTRLFGSNRYETQMAVYSYGADRGLWNAEGKAVVASAAGFADALSMSPVTFALKAPVFYCDESGNLPAAQASAAKGWKSFLLTGSSVVTSNSCESYLRGIGQVERLGGSDRYSTSRVINDYAVSHLGFTWDGAALTSGRAPYDALGGGAVQGSKRSVLALSDEGSPKDAVTSPLGGNPSRVTFFGDQVIYSMAYKTKMALSMGFDLTDIQGFRVYVDAGHGWNDSNNGVFDPGAIGVNGYREADFTKELANLVAGKLRSKGIDCFVNDDGGWYKLRNAEANNLNCGLMVSIHFNSGPGRGFESYIHSVNAASGAQELQRSIHSRLAPTLGIGDRGAKSEAFAVCSGRVPATLLEIAYINNWSDMNAYLAKKDQVAEAIAAGIAAL